MAYIDMMISNLTNEEVALRLATRFREARDRAGLSRRALAERAGVSAHTLRRFEDTGHIALPTLVALMRGLGVLEAFDDLFAAPQLSPLELLRARRAGSKAKAGTTNTGGGQRG